MSVIGEVVGIVACVAAVVSAYRDGAQIVQKIKEKRRRSDADLSPRYLELSLQQGATAVEQTHRAGVDRFGTAFREGDDTALNALRDITIQLQQSMLRELSKALEDDSMQDFTAVENASDAARLRTVNVLNDLFWRMQTDVSTNTHLQPAPADRNNALGGARVTPPLHRQIQAGPAPSLSRVYTLVEDNASQASAKPLRASPASTPKQKRNPNSLDYIAGIRDLFPRRTKSDDKSGAVGLDNELLETDMQRAAHRPPQDLPDSQPWQTNSHMFETMSLSDNPWASGIERPIQTGDKHVDKPHRRHTTLAIIPNQGNVTPMSINSPAKPDFQGFCKGAYCLQVRLKSDGMKLRNQSSSFTGEKYYFACSNSRCCFEAPACKTGKVWDVVSTTFKSTHSVEFRWSFLAKSHIEQSKVKKRNFKYRCIFCTVQSSDAPVWEGVDSLIEHVAQHQQTQLPTDGRVLVDGDDFDIHFMADYVPVDRESLRSRLSISTVQDGSLWSMSDDNNPWELH